MANLVSLASAPYAAAMAKKAARKGDGPWGEAIQYQFRERNLRQSHVVEGTGMSPNRVSRAANGLDVRTNTLRQFAEFFGIPFELVLVAPTRRLDPQTERRVIEQVTAEVRDTMDRHRPHTPARPIDPRMVAIARRLGKLSAKKQRTVLEVIARYEKGEKDARRKTKSEAPPVAKRMTGR